MKYEPENIPMFLWEDVIGTPGEYYLPHEKFIFRFGCTYKLDENIRMPKAGINGTAKRKARFCRVKS